MSFNDDTHENKHRINYSLIYGIVIAILAVISVVGVYQYKRANDLQLQLENQYARSFYDLSEYISNIDVSLKKAMLASNATQMSAISSDIYMKAAAAKSSLGQLPTNQADLENTSKFLSQVGDYTSYLSAKVIDTGSITEDEFKTLKDLSKTATTVSDNMQNLQTELYNGNLKFSTIQNVTAQAEEAKEGTDNSFGGGMGKVEKEMQSYPSLIYDGPFSEHIEKMEPEMLKNKKEVTQEQAIEMVRYFIGKERAQNIALNGETTNTISTYSFVSTPDPNSDRQISTEVTKVDGLMLWMLDNRYVENENLSVDEAIKKGTAFLESMGFMSMKQSYYEKNNNVATINYAYSSNNVTMYSDLIKVKIALDNGEVVGFESRGYIMSHKARDIPQVKLTEQQAKNMVSKHLNITSAKLCMIPLESKREVLCYEFKGSFDDQNYLIYVNAQSGKEEKILLLLESETGILTE